MRRAVLVLLAGLVAGPVWAEEPTSPRPWRYLLAERPARGAGGQTRQGRGETLVTLVDASGDLVLVSGSGSLQVTCDNCGGASPFEDNDAFTFNTSSVSTVGFVVDDTGTNSIAENSAGAPRMSPSRIPLFALTTDTGTRATFTGTSLNINCTGGCGGAASFNDNAAFTFGTTAVNVGAGVLDDATPNAATENSAAAFRISANRMQLAQIGDGAGNERRANVNASNALLVAQTGELPAGTQNIGDVDVASLPSVTIGTFPDNEPFNVAQFGGSAVVTGTGAGGAGIPRVTVSNDSSVIVGTFPDNEPFNLAQWLGSTAPTVGQKTMANSVPVVLPSDQAAIPVSQSGTWTVQPGNTANTTPWLVREMRNATSALTNVAASASNVTCLASNASRRKVVLYNDSTSHVFVKFGATASATSFTYRLEGGMHLEEDTYTGIIDCIWGSATGNARVTEITQ